MLARIPDYSITLGQMAERLKATAATVDRIEKAPAVSLSPDALTAERLLIRRPPRPADRSLR